MDWVQIRLDQNHMATTFELSISCDRARARIAEVVLSEVHGEIARLENELSEFRKESPVYQLNHARPFLNVKLTEDVRNLFKICEKFRNSSKGAFNHLCKSEGVPEVILAADGSSFFKTTEGTRLSFGAIGKGYALDRVRRILEAEGFTNYLLSAGGSSTLISGFASPQKPWTFAWSWKKDREGNWLGKKISHRSGSAVALGVSGTMEQGAHILGAHNNSLSALVACGTAARADALSTALFVLGWEGRDSLRDPLQATSLAWIDREENLSWNGDFQKLWGSPC